MKTILAAGAALVALAAAGSADAKTIKVCRTIVVHKHRHHAVRHHVVRHHARGDAGVAAGSVEARTTMLPASIAVPVVPVATAEEEAAASALNKSLDLWRICGWQNQEADAAVFVAWTRSHVMKDPLDPENKIVAWRPYGYASAERIDQNNDPKDRAATCNATADKRTELRRQMDHEAMMLLEAERNARR